MKSLKDLRTSLQEHDMGGDHVSQVHTPGYTPPNILILKRKTVRAFSSTERVALYYSEKLGRYFSVPYTIGQPGADDVVGVTEEQINEISIPTATRAFHARQELGDKARSKKKYREAIYHYAKATKTLDRRAKKYQRADRGEVVEEVLDEEHKIGSPVSFKSSITDKILKGKVFKVGTDHVVVHVKGDDGKYGIHHTVKKSQLVNSKLHEEVIQEDAISHLQKVKEFHTNTPLYHKDGSQTRVDPTTAHALLTVHGAMHSENQKKFADALEHSKAKFHKMLDFAWSQVK